jgi:hypothetical protein
MKSKKLYSAMVLCVVGWAGVAAAAEARGPIWADDNTVTVAICSGSEHVGAVDISNGTCSTWNMRAMLVGSFYWNVVSAYTNCLSTPQTPANYAYVNGMTGYRFYQYHHNHTASSYSRTCDRCALGLVGAAGQVYGARVHALNTQYNTVLTAWYAGYVTCEPKVGYIHIIGYPRL